MSRLQELQSSFRDAVVALDDGFEAEIAATDRVGVKDRIAIYANAYRSRLIECLEDNYDALHTLLGDDQFVALCQAYVDAHPPHHFSIRWYGDRLADFARVNAPYRDHPYVAELAAFQWTLLEAFDAADRTPVALAEVASIAPTEWPGMRLAFHPSVRRLDLRWNVPTIWSQIDQGHDPVDAPREGDGVSWLVWRQDLQQHFRSLDPDEAWAIDRAREGASFEELCEGLCSWHDESGVPVHAAGLLKRWINDGLVTELIT